MSPTFHVSRFTFHVLLAGVLCWGGLAACGKKGNPVPPEDVPPAKQSALGGQNMNPKQDSQ